MYVIMARNCNTYLYTPKGSSKPAATTNINSAHIFKSMEAAKIFLNNNVPKKTRKQYIISDYWEQVSKVSSSSQENGVSIDFSEVTSHISSLNEMLSDIGKYREYLAAEHSKVEAAINDIYHYIEFSNLNVVDGFKAYKQLQYYLQQRRKIKDAEQLAGLLSNNESINLSGYIAAMKSQANRNYTPRVLPELFK